MTAQHRHSWEQDRRPGREGFAVCSSPGCGQAAPKRAVLAYTMVLDAQLSPGLLAERRALAARPTRTPDEIAEAVRVRRALEAKAAELAREIPGATFGYVGNCGVDARGPYDDRSWSVFVPGGASGKVSVGGFRTDDLALMLAAWDDIARIAREVKR